MSFLEKTFKMAKTVGTFTANAATKFASSMAEEANKTRELQQKISGMNDDQLLKIVNSEGFLGKSSKEKGMAFAVLRKRGHSIEDINATK